MRSNRFNVLQSAVVTEIENARHDPIHPPPSLSLARLTVLLLALAALPGAAHARCNISDGVLLKLFPAGDLEEGNLRANEAIIQFQLPRDCPVAEPQTVCLDVWNTTACPPGGLQCDGAIRGSTGIQLTGGWMRSGTMICNSKFREAFDRGGVITAVNDAQFFVRIPDDDVRADRQNYLIVATYDPFRVLRIPIREDD